MDETLQGAGKPFGLAEYRATVPSIFTPLSDFEWRQLAAATQITVEQLKAEDKRGKVINFLQTMQPPDAKIPPPGDILNEIIIKTHHNQCTPDQSDVVALLRSYTNNESRIIWDTVKAFHNGIPHEFRPMIESGLEWKVSDQINLQVEDAIEQMIKGEKITNQAQKSVNTVLSIIEREEIRDRLAYTEGYIAYDEKKGDLMIAEYRARIDAGGIDGDVAFKSAKGMGMFNPAKVPALKEDVLYFKHGQQVIQEMRNLVSNMVGKA